MNTIKPKFYYEILVILNKKTERMIIWIKDEKIEYSNMKELETYVKNNCKALKNYNNIQKVIVMEITEEQYKELDRWYVNHSKPRDFTVFHN